MASTATTFISSINTAYPVAGVDNDTQGFRDNYANIKNGMQSMANEITNIEATGVFVATTNDLLQGTLQNAVLKSTGYTVSSNQIGFIGGPQTLDYAQGNYQVWKISSATTFSFANFPTVQTYSPMQLELYLDPNTSTHYTVTFAASTSTDILVDYNPNTQSGNPVTLSTCSSVLYEVARTTNVLTGSGNAYRIRFLGGPFKN